ncbi:NTP transferase domain-containing protein [Streptomyces sp. NPDC046831]|uniref:NTP transferase domain-containing protein n=1 Tax=Streptomyces sp. NPDC046831 TaxID=3154805 RepID=UPI0033EE5FBF
MTAYEPPEYEPPRPGPPGGAGEPGAAYDAVVLAGGGARRLGGIDKPGVRVGGRALLDRVLDACAGARTTVVVAEPRATGRPVRWTREEPPGAGPLAALEAGLRGTTAEHVVVLSADLPFVGKDTVRRLLDALRASAGDGVLLTDADGRDQPLVAAYRTAALRRGLTALADAAPGSGPRASGALRDAAFIEGSAAGSAPTDAASIKKPAEARALSDAESTRGSAPDGAPTAAESTRSSGVGSAPTGAESSRGSAPGTAPAGTASADGLAAGRGRSGTASADGSGAGSALTGLPLRRLTAVLDLSRVPDPVASFDCDTWDDIATARARIREHGHVLDEWITAVKDELGIDLDVDTNVLLDLARDAAHGVARPAAPLTTFLVGYAAAQGKGGPEAVAEAARKAAVLAQRWADEATADAGPGAEPDAG